MVAPAMGRRTGTYATWAVTPGLARQDVVSRRDDSCAGVSAGPLPRISVGYWVASPRARAWSARERETARVECPTVRRSSIRLVCDSTDRASAIPAFAVDNFDAESVRLATKSLRRERAGLQGEAMHGHAIRFVR